MNVFPWQGQLAFSWQLPLSCLCTFVNAVNYTYISFLSPPSPRQRSVDASCELPGHRCLLSSQRSQGMTCYCIAELCGIQAFTRVLSDKVENFLRAWIITNISVLCILHFARCQEYNRYLSTELNSYPTLFSFVIKRNISYCCSLRINPSEGIC